MNSLELFSGTQSVGKILKEKGYNVISVDITDYKGKHIPTHKCDILEFDYKQYPVGHFDIIHASPPCIYKRITRRGNEEGRYYSKKNIRNNRVF